MTIVCFLGTGTMGLPMARHLISDGLSVRAWNRTADRAQPLADDGAEVFEDPRDAAEGCDILVTMLSDTSSVLDSAARALPVLGRNAVWLQMSTIGMQGTERCLELAERHEAAFVDAPVVGTQGPAKKGELVVLASGPQSALEACERIFDAVGSRTLRLGAAGAGTRCKLVVNSWILGVTAVLAETISLAEILDTDPQHFFDAVAGGALDLPYARLKGEIMVARSFEDPVDFRLSLSRKDADLVLGAAESGSLEIPVLRAVADRLQRAERDGHGDEDMAATYCATAPAR